MSRFKYWLNETSALEAALGRFSRSLDGLARRDSFLVVEIRHILVAWRP